MTTLAVDAIPTSQDAALDHLVRKVAWRLIPILFLAYVVNFIDRINISFAKIQLGKALAMDDAAFGVGAGMFFIGFFVFEVPSNMILERIGARRWVPTIMVAWGIATTAMAYVTTPFQFYLIRFLIGFAEAGFFPGVVLFLTYWFPLSHRGRIMSWFMAALAISGVIGGPICGAIMEFLDGAHGLAGWQWLLVSTGLPCILVAAGIYLRLSDTPEQAEWLSANDRKRLIASLGKIKRPSASLKAGFASVWSWNCAWLYFLLICGGYGISFWMPTLFSQAGVGSSAKIGLLVSATNFAGLVSMLLLSRSSDLMQERRWHLTAAFALGCAGFIVIAMQIGNVAGMAIGAAIAYAGVLAGVPIFWTVPTRMLSPAASAVGIAIVASVGNLGGFAAPVLVGKVSAATGSLSGGFWIIGVLLLLGAVWSAVTLREAA
ncbi:MFS transporter [Duganella sp. LX20W]|uniref:MFS transporter n=1 Tax=Rugamonas brunnea TaxID=2758569 RepID=A0A7W2EWS2_9BURK|nr:MFS transporter [Rugamonas brunnea]MBA5640059.1 MFS transporter [Rugamonas brunnea]